MKKLINLIALVMLVSTNVLTPFSYAQVETPEMIPENEVENAVETGEIPEINEETPELVSEEKGELGQEKQDSETPEDVLPNVQDDVETPTSDETENVDTESDEVVQSLEEASENEIEDENLEGDEIEDDFSLQKEDETMIMQVQSGTIATLLPGQQFNQTIKKLAGNTSASPYVSDNKITQIIYTGEIPSGVSTTGRISIDDSGKEIVAWYDNGTIYYWTEAEKIYLNEYSNRMFGGMENLKKIEIKDWDTSNVKDMSYMFSSNPSLIELDVSHFDTSNVTNMSYMFAGSSGLIELDVSHFDTSNVITMDQMFADCRSLTELDVSHFDTSNVTNMQYMFNNCSSLTKLDVSGWNTSNVTSMRKMFYNCAKLMELDVSNRDVHNVGTMTDMFYNCRSLIKLDLTNRDTSNVSYMSTMFGSCENLETIYVSTGFTLSGLSFSYTIFSNNFKLIGGNGTRYNGNGASNNYAKIDNQVQSGYFTDKSSPIRVDFMVGLDLYETQMVNFGDKVIKPNFEKQGVKFKEWVTKDADQYNFDNEVKSYMALYARFDTNEAMLLPGYEFNQTIKRLAGQDNSYYYSANDSITQIIRWTGNSIPEGVILTGIISVPYSDNDVVAWYDSGIIYYYTDAEKIYLNPNSSNMFMNIQKVTKIDTVNWDTSKVEDMSNMFSYCSSLTSIDISHFDTSNVENMGGAFSNCSGLMNLDLNNWDTSNVTNMAGMFSSCSNLAEVLVSNWDTSNVTSMAGMFNSCSGLTNLDLSNWDTSNVTNMYNMFNTCRNLEVIYASIGFTTDKVTSSNYMFTNDFKLEGGNGTRHSYYYTDKTYARIDTAETSGYFHGVHLVNFDTDGGTSIPKQGFSYGSSYKINEPSPQPEKQYYHLKGWYTLGGEKWDFDEYITEDMTLYAKWECADGYENKGGECIKKSSGSSGGGGGGGSSSSKTDTGSASSQTGNQINSNTGDTASTGTNIKEPETNTGSNVQTGSQVASPEEISQNDSNTPMDTSTSSQNDTKTYSTEFQEAYEFAKGNGITTMPTIQKANMEGKLTRIAMAKMLSQYAINVLGKTPDTSKTVKFKDVTSKKDADYDNGVTLAYQLGIMGQNMPGNNFRPNDEVTRAEFATALSRMAYNTLDGEYKATSKYYVHHMEKLVKEGIITNDDPNMKELRGYVMIMLMRSAK